MLFWNNTNTVVQSIWATLESLIIVSTPVVLILRNQRKLDKRLDKIEYQLYENGGGSMKDQMNRQDQALHELQVNQAIIMTKIKSR
jgi:hypothetical protein